MQKTQFPSVRNCNSGVVFLTVGSNLESSHMRVRPLLSVPPGTFIKIYTSLTLTTPTPLSSYSTLYKRKISEEFSKGMRDDITFETFRTRE